ncbi:MAG: anaerobic sulfatase maturase [Kiritimatiellaeota bacterium]|nr:anaerobic sulfatase maturase [Kiritimatiellota bacterium]
MVKPIGPACNLDCRYCFYLEKARLFAGEGSPRIADDVLESFVKQYIAAQPDAPEINFAWQGGEPTLMGVDFFRKVVALQNKYSGGKKITNAFQTNATLLDDEWCAFLAANQFLTGVSLDGPRELHDAYRRDKQDRSTFDAVVAAVARLKQHGAPFNTLTVVSRANSKQPLKVYRFLKEIGSTFHQYIPIVERVANPAAQALGLPLATPPGAAAEDATVTEWSVLPEDYGKFLIAIFDDWVRQDVGKIFVQLFDAALAAWVGQSGTVCVYAEKCGNAIILEHNGEVYACDHFVYPQYLLGNLKDTPLTDLAWSAQQQKFGRDKKMLLPPYCRKCEYLFACNGECPKHRFARTPAGDPGLSYLCTGLRRFFQHATPKMDAMARLVQAGRPAAEIMKKS